VFAVATMVTHPLLMRVLCAIACQLLTLRGNLDEFSQRILRYDAPSAARSELPPKEFPSPQTTLKLLQDPKYFHAESSTPTAVESLPPFLQAVVARMSDDADDVAVAPGGSAMTAFGAMITYLQRCLIDQSLLSLAQFYAYVPPAIADNTTAGDADDEVTVEPTQPSDTVVANVPIGFTENSSRMVLDGTTIVNLDIVSNSVDGGRKGSLLDTLDRCVTAQGKRMFTQWLCAPLRQVADIHARLEAVSDLMGRRDLMDTVRNLFKQLPDIDRLLSRVHTLGLKLSPDHPENRAVYYEASTYNKRKIRDFLTALRGLKVARRVQDMFVDAADPTQLVEGLSSLILRDLMIEKTPNISKTLAFFDGAFDARQAEAEGCIIPKRVCVWFVVRVSC
jgi:DNA mismatch repair protein MSH6